MNRKELLSIRPDPLASFCHRASRSNWTRHRAASLALFFLLACLPSARAQVSASVKDTVTDPSGAPVPSAAVKTKNLETGAMRSSVTDEAGRYLVLSLPLGEYEIRVTKGGFQDAIRSGIHLVVGEEASVDLRLAVGVEISQITVTADAPIVATTAKDISGLVGEQAVKELPLNGRSYDLLLPLNPGIVNFSSHKTCATAISHSSTPNNLHHHANLHHPNRTPIARSTYPDDTPHNH